MHEQISGLLYRFNIVQYNEIFTVILTALTAALACVAARFLVRYITVGFFKKIRLRKESAWIDIFLKNRLFHRASNLAIPIVIHIFSYQLWELFRFWHIIISTYLIFVALYVIDSLLKCINDIYSLREVSKNIPIKGFLQTVEVIVFVVGGILIISNIMNMNPIALIGSLGAMTAIITIVFKDAILGFVAGIQLTAIDLVRIDDIIEIPAESIIGKVTEISLTTVKLENFDKTITSVPAYTLVSDVFVNRRGMLEAGVRQIKRSLKIDAMSVKICDDVMIEKYRKIELLREYIESRQLEIETHNQHLNCDLSETANGRRMTNIGVFRQYVTAYLKSHKDINQDNMLMVRQLEADEKGIPFQIYAFTNTTDMVEYESIQADIFDHIYAVVPEFNLVLYQTPSGKDIRGTYSE
jgi:miniconductance mechanosensitive channel